MIKRRAPRLSFPWRHTSERLNIKARSMTDTQYMTRVLPFISDIFCVPPKIEDSLQTATSEAQEEALQDILPYILGSEGGPRELNSRGIPKLRKADHVRFLHRTLEKKPAAYTGLDAARPWVMYWTLTALSLLDEDVSEYQQRVVSTLSAAQNATGGFGGGDGQLSHVATTYAAVLSLAMVGGSAAFDMIDRHALWQWLGQVKDEDGGFRMAVGAELDARGVYCAMVIITLLNLPLDLPPKAPARQAGLTSFIDKAPEWIAKCQSYEGGLSARPHGEPHAAYTYCGLACLSILGEPKKMLNSYLHMPSMISWLSARQNAPEGGFSGRTNKLVDSCYSHWVGGCWSFVSEALRTRGEPQPQNIWNKEGIIRYILCAAQHEIGGMRDKPHKYPDGYHSCYALAGLSAMQHRHMFEVPSPPQHDALEHAFGWKVVEADESEDDRFFDDEDHLLPLHPVFTIPYKSAAAFRARAIGQNNAEVIRE